MLIRWQQQLVRPSRVFDISAPVVSTRAAVLNVAGSQASSSLSVIGVNFAFTDSTPSGRLGTAGCSTTSWSSSTSVYCEGSVADPLVVTAGGVAGTATLTFSYDGEQTSERLCFLPFLLHQLELH